MKKNLCNVSKPERRVVRLSSPQKAAMRYAIDDRALEIGGADGRPVRIDVAERLCNMGLLSPHGGSIDRGYGRTYIFKPTELGILVMANGKYDQERT